jgi:predicted bacteriocin transport accessory protein
MKKKSLIVILSFFIILLIAMFFYVRQNYVRKDNLSDIIKIADENKEEYYIQKYDENIENLKNEGLLKNISSTNINNMNEDAKEIIYIGRSDCPYCQEFLPELSTVLEDNTVSIQYLDTNIEKEKNSEEFKKLVNELDIQGVPTLLKIENNQFEEYGTKETNLELFIKN